MTPQADERQALHSRVLWNQRATWHVVCMLKDSVVGVSHKGVEIRSADIDTKFWGSVHHIMSSCVISSESGLVI